ncbi:MAG: nicotinate-nucleotide adenylyltransferase [Aminobacterium sp.]|uniref:nicotinate-nucleotide adenylyltransferase n=1 Tax=unclassified Aminobacterium TaxID=2685012 RepID=UPI0027DAF8D1|nr:MULTISPECIES: nicotinate-nucleotide adenylyltransferase [unclassified Aminobacterium]MDD2206997.1 nicotinate-nucleotide adenylyltransferase [Aminobacterium sp.]MDD3707967.1 nicotinate-nucleotide adenylyltransferase [Aminobacterium sp.]MDD4228932.1 nicotinate-nucleotide adenylyltransferase [Aminobacterium sp.]MDD4551874.1 nicotinate-nucleotide adenylyltransferase [Aminobacterium sp.]MEA4876312.1 nicotinate-nucleotide adenylyltransferase [Aminobacterium sp.]
MTFGRHIIRTKKIGIMGGTFDPIHYGHLLAAEESFFALDLDEVIFVPTGDPPHKRMKRVSSAEDRYTMTLLATLDNAHFKVSRIEIDRKESSHTVDTLREMGHWYAPDSVQFFFITGLDAVLNLTTWKEYKVLPTLCQIVAINRPGYNQSGKLERITELLPEEFNGHVVPLEIPLLSISSTDIRQRIENGKNIRYLVPELVERYIYKKGLYKRIGR